MTDSRVFLCFRLVFKQARRHCNCLLWLAGVPARVRTHDVTKQVEYIGDVQNLVEKLSDLPAGGQVLMGPLTYQRIYSRLEEFRIHSLQKSYEQPARSASWMFNKLTIHDRLSCFCSVYFTCCLSPRLSCAYLPER